MTEAPWKLSKEMELELALSDATLMSELTADWVARALGAEKAKPPTPDDEDLRLLYFAVNQVREFVRQADRAFHRPD